MPRLDDLDVVVAALDRSLPFYQELLGYTDSGEIVGERGERVIYIGPPGVEGGPRTAIGLREKQSGAHGVPFDRYAVGVHHVAFAAWSRTAVDERAEWLRTHEVELESEPQEYTYSPGYYAVFFFDPDGLKLEIVHVPGLTAA